MYLLKVLAPEEGAQLLLHGRTHKFVIPGMWGKYLCFAVSHPGSFREIPLTNFEVLDISWDLASIMGPTSHGALVIVWTLGGT